MDKRKELLDYLRSNHVGRENAVSSTGLEQRFEISGRTVRRMVNRFRQEGYPVCSDSTGYYLASSQKEINNTVSRLNGLVTGVSNARTGLLQARAVTEPVRLDITIRINP